LVFSRVPFKLKGGIREVMAEDMPHVNEDKMKEMVKKLESEVATLQSRGCGMLSSADFLRLVIIDNLRQARKDFWNRDWDRCGRKFIIDPFNPVNLTPFSYDLSIGAEIYSCNQEIVKKLGNGEDNIYWMLPRETIVIKTEEFIALPPYYSATVWPRFKMVTEAIFQSMVKIDPTWYGELGIATTNLSAALYPIRRGDTFATLIIYETKSKTGIFLYRKENLPEPKEVSLKHIGNYQEISDRLIAADLGVLCEISGDTMKLKQLPKTDAFAKLMNLDPSNEWKEAVIECVNSYPREMDSLGLNTLELIKPRPPKGQKLKRTDIQKVECSPTDLEDAAINYGVPFNLLPGIPEFIMEKIEREASPRIRAEVEANLFPKTVTLTLTVLGFLSLIVAIVAFLMDKYRLNSPLTGVDWPGTVAIVLIAIGVILIAAIVFLLLPRLTDSRAINRLKREMEELKKQISSEQRSI
jgi:deoxycytidine triphosphate deaminase